MPYEPKKVQACLKAMRTKNADGRYPVNIGGPRVVILRDDTAEVSEGGIIIPDEAQRKQTKGTLLAIGDGVQHVSNEYMVTDLQLQDYVTFNVYDGVEHDIDTVMGTISVLVTHVRNVYLYGPRKV